MAVIAADNRPTATVDAVILTFAAVTAFARAVFPAAAALAFSPMTAKPVIAAFRPAPPVSVANNPLSVAMAGDNIAAAPAKPVTPITLACIGSGN